MILFSRSGDSGERSIYDRFRIEKYNIKTEGLYKTNSQHYILCAVTDSELKDLNIYLDDIHYLGTHIAIVNVLPTSAVKIEDRTIEQIIGLTSTFRTRHDLLSQLYLELDRVLTGYKILLSNQYILIHHIEEINDSIRNDLQDIVDRISISFSYKFERVETLDGIQEEDISSGLYSELIVSRFSMKGYSGRTRALAEADEDFWMSNRLNLFTDSSLKKNRLMGTWNFDSSVCLIDLNNCQAPQNILNLLSIYEKIIFIAPQTKEIILFMGALSISKADLIKLVERKRVYFIFPKNFNEYEKNFLEELSEFDHDAMLFTRKLAAITVSDLRKRNPLLFPTISISERKEALHGIKALIEKSRMSPTENKFLQFLIDQLQSIWYSYPEITHTLGSMGTNMFGLSGLMSSFLNLKEMQVLYLSEATRIVEWSAALDANLIPYPFLGKDVEQVYKATAMLYSGVPNRDWIPTNYNYANLAIEKLLVVDSNVPPIDFADSFSNADINLFRRQIFDMVRHKRDINELNESINRFNSWVKQHDKKNNREWDISGFVLDGLTDGGLPFISWAIARIHMLMRKYGINNESLVSFLDSIETDTVPTAVLVSRMRNQLVEKWKDKRYSA